MKNLFIKICVAASAMLNCNDAKGQGVTAATGTSATRFMIGITGGLTTLSGNFAKTDYNDNSSGFSGPGYNFGITGTWFLNRNFGFSALISYHSYGINGIGNIAQGFQKDFFVDSASAISKGHTGTFNVLVGPCFSLPLSDKFSVDLRLLAGLVDASLIGWTVILTDGGISHPDAPPTQDVAHAIAFGKQIGLGLRYNIGSHWGLMINSDYYYSKPNFSISSEHRNASNGRKITSYNEAIMGFNANLTLVYLLKHG